MRILSPKTSNRIYLVFTIISVIIFAFFFSSNYWMSITQKSKSENYNSTVKLNDYNIKITDCSYHDNICEFSLKFRKTKDTSKQYYPKVTSVRFDESITEYIFETGEKYDEFSQVITVKDIPSEFTFMRIVVETSMPDVVYEDSYDEFGELVPGYTEEGELYSIVVKIDKSDMANERIEPSKGYAAEEISEADTTEKATTTSLITTTAPAMVQSTTTTKLASENKITASAEITSRTEKATATETQIINSQTENEPAYADNNYQGGQNGGAEYDNQTAYYPDETVAQTQQNTQQTDPPTAQEPEQTTAKSTTTTQPHVNAIKLKTDFTDNNIKLEVGKTSQIKAEISPSNAIDKSVKWESNRSDIAEIDENGEVKAVSKGKAIVTATTSDGGLKASCMVTVS